MIKAVIKKAPVEREGNPPIQPGLNLLSAARRIGAMSGF